MVAQSSCDNTHTRTPLIQQQIPTDIFLSTCTTQYPESLPLLLVGQRSLTQLLLLPRPLLPMPPPPPPPPPHLTLSALRQPPVMSHSSPRPRLVPLFLALLHNPVLHDVHSEIVPHSTEGYREHHVKKKRRRLLFLNENMFLRGRGRRHRRKSFCGALPFYTQPAGQFDRPMPFRVVVGTASFGWWVIKFIYK